MQTQIERRSVYEIPPSSTNLREVAPPQSDIPIYLVIQSIVVENDEKYIVIERVDAFEVVEPIVIELILWSGEGEHLLIGYGLLSKQHFPASLVSLRLGQWAHIVLNIVIPASPPGGQLGLW